MGQWDRPFRGIGVQPTSGRQTADRLPEQQAKRGQTRMPGGVGGVAGAIQPRRSDSLALCPSNPKGRLPGIVSNHRDLNLCIACSEEKVIRKPLQIASTSAARIEMVSLRESPCAIEGLGEFYPEVISKPPGNRFVVIENLTNLSLDCRMIEDLPAHRPTALRSSS